MTPVRFQVNAPGAHLVEFVSDTFGWDFPQPMYRDGKWWVFSMDLPDDARIEYQFVVDGHWHLDPGNREKCENGFGSWNSVYRGPEYRIEVPDTTPIIPLRRMNFSVPGPVPKRNITVVRPVGRHKDLPIVVFADGSEYFTKVRPQMMIQNLAEKGLVPSCITVFVPPVDRMREYLHNSADYEAYIAHHVLPEVRLRVPASEDPRRVFVCGASLGGLISMRLAQHYPEIIAGGVHSQSGAFWASPGSFSRAALKKLSKTTALYFDWGTFEGVLTASNDRMIEALERMGRPHERATTPEGHNWTAWRRRYAAGALALLGPLR